MYKMMNKIGSIANKCLVRYSFKKWDIFIYRIAHLVNQNNGIILLVGQLIIVGM